MNLFPGALHQPFIESDEVPSTGRADATLANEAMPALSETARKVRPIPCA